MAGAVLNTLNTRLDADAIAFMLQHGEAKVLLTDREFSATVEKALEIAKARPLVIDVDDPEYQRRKIARRDRLREIPALRRSGIRLATSG